MIVRLTAKNQRRLFDDDIERLHRKAGMHYSIGQHISLLIDRVAALEAQGTEAGTAETAGLGPKDDGPVGSADAPEQPPETNHE
jgi:hypothetical protein